MSIPGQRQISAEQAALELDALKNRATAMELVLQALIESHPAPRELVNKWRVISFDAIEQSRPKKSHVGVPTQAEWLHKKLNEWSQIIHNIEAK